MERTDFARASLDRLLAREKTPVKQLEYMFASHMSVGPPDDFYSWQEEDRKAWMNTHRLKADVIVNAMRDIAPDHPIAKG